MKSLIFLTFVFVLVSPVHNIAVPQEGSTLVVLASKWTKSRQIVERLNPVVNTAPAAAMIPENRNFERNRRINSPAGVRDPNIDTVDGRAAALERSIQESRTLEAKPLDGYAYRVKVKNSSPKIVEIIFWEYQFIDPADPASASRRQFLCAVNIKADKEKEIQAFSISGPSGVVNVGTLSKKEANPYQERIVINRVEYADGTIWQRKDWRFAEIKLTFQRAVGTPWGTEMCRPL